MDAVILRREARHAVARRATLPLHMHIHIGTTQSHGPLVSVAITAVGTSCADVTHRRWLWRPCD